MNGISADGRDICYYRSRFWTSFDNRLHYGVLKFVAHRADGGLAHHDRDDFFFGIDPEVRAVDSAPAEAAVGNADVSGECVLNHAYGEAEAFAGRAAGKSVRNVHGPHELHGARAQQAMAVKFAAVGEHLGEVGVVVDGGDETAAAGEVDRSEEHTSE